MENFISPLRFKKSNYVIRLFSNKYVKKANWQKIEQGWYWVDTYFGIDHDSIDPVDTVK